LGVYKIGNMPLSIGAFCFTGSFGGGWIGFVLPTVSLVSFCQNQFLSLVPSSQRERLRSRRVVRPGCTI
jgi:hypothetical protein